MRNIVLIFVLLLLFGCVRPVAVSTSADEEPTIPESRVVGEERTDFLVYEGPGSWKSETRSLKEILYKNGATYLAVGADQLNEFTAERFAGFKAILFAGGNSISVSESISREVGEMIRLAVREGGMNYLGFCAGAWLAVASNEENSLGVVDGPSLAPSFLSLLGREYALDDAVFPNGERRRLLWYGGPVTVDGPGAVIARYSDGTAAISQLRVGKGLVIISGFHPAANKRILAGLGLKERQAVAPDIAWRLLRATISGESLPTF